MSEQLPELTAEEQADFEADMARLNRGPVPEIHWPAPEGMRWQRVSPEALASTSTPLRRAMLHKLAEVLRQQNQSRDG